MNFLFINDLLIGKKGLVSFVFASYKQKNLQNLNCQLNCVKSLHKSIMREGKKKTLQKIVC